MSTALTNAGIAIFVKTPGLSPLKTRLAATLGVQYAENWYRLAAAAVAEVARLSGAEVYWAVAEPEAMHATIWQDLPRLAQVPNAAGGTLSLGARMQYVQQQLFARHGAGILLGADTPHLDGAVLRAVIEYLREGTPRWAIAPALDGGFWLHGANRSAPLSAWEAPCYSHADTLAQFLLAMQGQGELRRFQSETDVDTAADLVACTTALSQLAQPSGKQAALLQWMRLQGRMNSVGALENPAAKR